MAHIGLVIPPISGHLNPSLTLARTLGRRGHRVTLMTLPDGEARARKAGLDFVAVGGKEFPLGTIRRHNEAIGRLKGMAGLRYAVRWFTDSARMWHRELPDALRQARVDGVLVDQVEAGAIDVAEHLRLPFAVVCNALALDTVPEVPSGLTPWGYSRHPLARFRNIAMTRVMSFLFREWSHTLNRQRRIWGLTPVPRELRILPGRTYLSQQPHWFDFPARKPSGFHYTAPWHVPEGGLPAEFPWSRLDGRPLIYASLGTLQNGLDQMYQKIAQACVGLDAQLVISFGAPGRTELPPLAGDPVAVPFAPQLELLRRASLVITHAGLNTALETLAAGVPMVALPITNDQPGVAARLKWLGVAELLPARQLTPARLRRLIDRVRRDSKYAERSADFARRLAQQSGPELAADIFERVLTSKA